MVRSQSVLCVCVDVCVCLHVKTRHEANDKYLHKVLCVYSMCARYVCTVCVYNICARYVCTVCVFLWVGG